MNVFKSDAVIWWAAVFRWRGVGREEEGGVGGGWRWSGDGVWDKPVCTSLQLSVPT